MERILSKEEIAELLAAVQEGAIDTGEEFEADERRVVGAEVDVKAPAKSVSRLDLLRVQDSGRWRFPNFDITLDSFARNYGMSLTNRLQTSVLVRRASMESLEFDPLLHQLPKNGLIGIVRLDPLKAGGLVVLDDQLSFSLLELVLGGTSRGKFTIFERPMTAIEINVLRGILQDCCPDLKKAFAPLEAIESTLVKVETNPRLVNIVPADAAVLVTRFNITVDDLSGQMLLVIPHATLEPLRDTLRAGGAASSSSRHDTLWQNRIRQELGDTPLTLSATIGEVTLRVRDILNFQVGDIIDLGCEPNTPLTLSVEGRPKFVAGAGLKGGKKAVRVLESISET